MSKKLEGINVDEISEISAKLEQIDKIGDIGMKVDGMVAKVDGFVKSIAQFIMEKQYSNERTAVYKRVKRKVKRFFTAFPPGSQGGPSIPQSYFTSE
ncbi:hypothetical protein KQX54_002160, partial [Cotesia glomerata]